MDFLANDLSFHGQFRALDDFFGAVERLMSIRQEIGGYGATFFCHRRVAHATVAPGVTMEKAIQGMPREKRLAWVQWLTKQGPYWEDERHHLPDDWLEVSGEPVTDTAVGEVAACNHYGVARQLVSVNPSDWVYTPIRVTWRREDDSSLVTDIVNHWEPRTVVTTLATAPPSFGSWASLEAHVRRLCGRLTFADGAFAALEGHPYVPGAAQRIVMRLQVLDELRGCFDNNGKRTSRGDELLAEHFAGPKAWFTDSSDSEKRMFKNELSFRHPRARGKYLSCTWHGKVKTPQLRIHFSWPITATDPLYVAYVGPKLTKT